MAENFLVVGGDLRQIYLASKLSTVHNVALMGFAENLIDDDNIKRFENAKDSFKRADYIILPIPASSDFVTVSCPFSQKNIMLENLVPLLKENGIIFGGKIEGSLKKFCEENGFLAVDYLEREELAAANAIPTAEGAIQTAMEELPTTIFGSKVLVIGFGRIGKALTKMLVDLGAKVSTSTGSYDKMEWIKFYGATPINTNKLEETLEEYDLIINTAPTKILNRQKLSKIKNSALIIDLASKPGGVDFEFARQLGKKVIWALSLPGKVAPKTSGEIIADTILNILEERGGEGG